MSRHHRPRQLLGELLQEEQEPFVLDAFLEEKRAQVVSRNHHRDPATTLGQILLRRRQPTREVAAAESMPSSCEAAGPCCSSSFSSSTALVSIPKSSRCNSPCRSSSSHYSSPASMATLTRHHPLVYKSSSLCLVSPFPEPARRTALSILLEAAAGRAHGKQSKRQRSKKKKSRNKKQGSGRKQRDRQGGGSGGGSFLRSLFSSLVKKRKTNRTEITDGRDEQVPPVSMADILNWKRRPDQKKMQQEKDRDVRCLWDEKDNDGESTRVGVRHWGDEQRGSGSPTTACNDKEALKGDMCGGVNVQDHDDEELGDFVRSWGYANNPPPGSDGCSTRSSSTNTRRHHRSGGSSFSCSTVSLSSSCDNRTGDNLDETGSWTSSSTMQGGCSSSPLHPHQLQEEEEEEEQQQQEEDGRQPLSCFGTGHDDAVEGAEAAAAGPAPEKSHHRDQDGVLEQEQTNKGNESSEPHDHGPCSCACGPVVDRDQLSPVSVLEPATDFDDEDEADEHEKGTGDDHDRRSTIGRVREGSRRLKDGEEPVAGEDEDNNNDQSQSLTIVLESKDQILSKLNRLEWLAAAGIQPVNLDNSFAQSSREEQHVVIHIDDDRCCASSSQYNAENEVEDHCGGQGHDGQQKQLQLQLHHDHNDDDHHALPNCTPFEYCDHAEVGPEAGMAQLVINGKFIVRACWEDADVLISSNTATIDMMVEEDLAKEGRGERGEQEDCWRGAAKDQADEVVNVIEASVFTMLVHDLCCDLYTTGGGHVVRRGFNDDGAVFG